MLRRITKSGPKYRGKGIPDHVTASHLIGYLDLQEESQASDGDGRFMEERDAKFAVTKTDRTITAA